MVGAIDVGVDAVAGEQLGRGHVGIGHELDGVRVTLQPGHDRFLEVAVAGGRGVEGDVEGHGLLVTTERGDDRRRRLVEAGALVGAQRRIGRGAGIAHADHELAIGEVGRSALVGVGGGHPDRADRDPEPEGDGGQRGGGAGLVPGQVPQRQPGRERQVPGQPAEQADGGRRRQHGAHHDGHQAGDEQQRLHVRAPRLGEVDAGQPDTDEDDGGHDRAARRAGWRGPAGQGGRHRQARRRPGRPPRRHRRDPDGQRVDGHDQPPGQGQAVDATVGDRLDGGRRQQPAGDAEGGADHGGDHADDGAVGQHHHAHVAVGGADGGEQPELALAALRHHDEGGRRDQAHERQGHGRRRQHQHGGAAVVGARLLDVERDRRGVAGGTGTAGTRIDEHGVGRRRGQAAWRDEGEAFAQRVGVLDDADHHRRLIAEDDGRPEGGAEEVGGAWGEGHLAGRRRVPALAPGHHRVAVGPVRVLVADVERAAPSPARRRRCGRRRRPRRSGCGRRRWRPAPERDRCRRAGSGRRPTRTGRRDLGSRRAPSPTRRRRRRRRSVSRRTTSNCWRQSRRAKRSAHRSTARRAARSPLMRRAGRPAAIRGRAPGRSGR